MWPNPEAPRPSGYGRGPVRPPSILRLLLYLALVIAAMWWLARQAATL